MLFEIQPISDVRNWTEPIVTGRLERGPEPGSRGHMYVHLHYGPMTRASPKETVVDRLQKLTFAPAGLSPAEHASLCWTHNRTGHSYERRLKW